MKKLLTSILLFASLAASACWFTEANFNATYIAGVNNFFAHYIEAATIGAASYSNGMTVAMPLTVWVKEEWSPVVAKIRTLLDRYK